MTTVAHPQPSDSQGEDPNDRVSFKTWVGVFGTVLGTFMAVLDI